MKLPELLERHGIDSDDFLARIYRRQDFTGPDTGPGIRPAIYVNAAFVWNSQPEGYEFWNRIFDEWDNEEDQERWPEMDVALGMDPLMAELMEVRDEAADYS